MSDSEHGGLLRARDGGEQQVTTLELFFDLVFAITQLSHRLLDHLTIGRVLGTLLLLVAGGLLRDEARYVLWTIAVMLEYAGPVVGFWTPGFGRSTTADWTVEGGHFAERCRLFVILALGESILVTGTTFGEVQPSVATVSAFVVAFLGSVALWWLYFARSAEAASRTFSSSEYPGRVARSAYTYFHLPIVAGIIAVAAADEITVAHPDEHGTLGSDSLILGGTALFLAGHALFKWAVFGVLSWPRVLAISALIALLPMSPAIPTLALTGLSGLIVVGIAVWEFATPGL